jgi:hypothetical protein
MAGLNDGISSTQYLVTTVSGTNSQATSGVYTQLDATAATITTLTTTNPISGTTVSLAFPVAYTGSPIIGNLAMQVGVATPADAVLAVIFPKPFAAAPKIFLSETALTGSNASAAYTSGTVSTGSFMLYGGSNVPYNWLAIGSGRI